MRGQWQGKLTLNPLSSHPCRFSFTSCISLFIWRPCIHALYTGILRSLCFRLIRKCLNRLSRCSANGCVTAWSTGSTASSSARTREGPSGRPRWPTTSCSTLPSSVTGELKVDSFSGSCTIRQTELERPWKKHLLVVQEHPVQGHLHPNGFFVAIGQRPRNCSSFFYHLLSFYPISHT